ncbi:MAG: hypothetical protein ACFFB0_02550 [Promethearchaeota archaeon]
MTVHGNQYLLPYFINKVTGRQTIQGNDELSLSFYLLTKDLGKKHKIISFSRLLWPILSIQGVISTHIMLDGITLLNKIGRITNPPRQPMVGHILRNIENRTKIEQLKKLIDVLTYKDIEAKEIGEGEESEFQNLQIKGLISPDFLQALINIIPLIEYNPISDYIVLDTSITTENALNITEKYREIINTMKGNALRWKTQIDLIEKEVSKWLIDLNVQLKDVESRYSSQITKTSSTIDPNLVDQQLKLEQDKIDQWSVNEKKNIIENIITLFKTSERQLEEIIKKNKFFTSGDSLKSKVYEDVIPHFENHFVYLKEEIMKFLKSLESLNQRFIELKQRGLKVDDDAKRKLTEYRETIKMMLQDRDKLLSEVESEKEVKISELYVIKEHIESLFNEIKNIVQIKYNNCLQEAQELTSWSLNDNRTELFSRPIQWIYIPFYAIIFEDESNFEEYMHLLLPGYITNNPNAIYEEISDQFVSLKNLVYEKFESDMATRSNFEFSCERNNLIKDPNIRKKFQLGLSKLREKGLINDDIEKKVKEYIKFYT